MQHQVTFLALPLLQQCDDNGAVVGQRVDAASFGWVSPVALVGDIGELADTSFLITRTSTQPSVTQHLLSMTAAAWTHDRKPPAPPSINRKHNGKEVDKCQCEE